MGAWNILRHLEIVSGEIVTCAERRLPPSRLVEVPEPDYYHTVIEDGIYESRFEVGDRVEKGQTLGYVHFVQYPHRPPLAVPARRDGLLLGLRGPGFVEVGDTVALLGRVSS